MCQRNVEVGSILYLMPTHSVAKFVEVLRCTRNSARGPVAPWVSDDGSLTSIKVFQIDPMPNIDELAITVLSVSVCITV